jgi:cyclic di-GMP phosphodiesterase
LNGPAHAARGVHRVRLAGPPEAVARWRAAFDAAGIDARPDLAESDVILLAVDVTSTQVALAVRELRLLAPGLPVVVAGALADPALVRAVWRAGASDVLFDAEPQELATSIARAVERHRLGSDVHAILERYTAGLGERSRRLERALASLDRSYEGTLRALIRALDVREQETACHSHRVALWTLYFSIAASVPEEKLLEIHRGSLLHDVGKIGIPDPILLKRGELTEEEWSVMRTHPRIGFEILSQVEYLKGAGAIPFSHHERWSGDGYPQGLRGEEIPLGARLFAIIDVYDALRSERPYKRALPHARSLEIMRAEAGTHFDPGLFELFVGLPEETWSQLASPDLATMTFPELRELARTVGERMGRKERIDAGTAP